MVHISIWSLSGIDVCLCVWDVCVCVCVCVCVRVEGTGRVHGFSMLVLPEI